MDFDRTESQQAIAAAAAEVLDRSRPAGKLPAGPGTREFAAQWKELAQAGLLALALPDWLGGDGLSVLDTAVLLTELGRRAEPGPALATLMLGVLPVTRWAGRHVQQTVLAGVAAGDTLLTAAVREPSDPMPLVPATTVTLDGVPGAGLGPVELGTVSGTKVGVPYAAEARWVLVPASFAAGGVGVVLVDPAAPGVTAVRTPSSAGEPEYTLRLDRAPVAHLLNAGLDGRDVADLGQLALAGACGLADGLLAGALDLTTRHVGSREQFGRPLATFQAVAQQIADISITARTLHLATLSACWRLDTGLDAAADLDVAGYWLAEHGPPALRACHHLHGGLGMDVSYPLPRYSALVKDLVRFTGGAEYRLDTLAARVCD